MNSVLRGTGEWEPLMIDEKCEMLIRDFAFVEWDERGTGLLKISDLNDERSTLTHATDALGYWAAIDIPSSNVYISKNDDNYMELPRENEARRQWMSELHGKRASGAGLTGLDLE